MAVTVRLGGALAAGVLLLTAPAAAQIPYRPIPAPDAIRLAEAFRLAHQVGGQVWPGWDTIPFPVLLITDSVEYLVHHPAPPGDFTAIGTDPILHTGVWARPRVFPRGLLATAPFIAGINTVAVGTPAATHKRPTQWVLTLLHEHFHQLQYGMPGYYDGVARLDLARGDSTGMWMLTFPFPWDSAPVVGAIRALATALARGVPAAPTEVKARVGEVRAARARLRELLTADDDRYLEFQLWQEGVARYTEYAVAREAAVAGPPSEAFRALPDFDDYRTAARGELTRLQRELADERPAEDRRVVAYSLGAATALLLDQVAPGWRKRYFAEPFALSPLFPVSSR